MMELTLYKKKKNDPTRCDENKERIKKTPKTQVKANYLKKRLKTFFSVFCFRFINLFRLCPH